MRILKAVALLAIAGCAAPNSAPVAVAPPVESRVQVCLVDPLAPGGTMTVSAIHPAGTGDTLVLQPSGRVPIRQLVAGSKVWSGTAVQLTTSGGRVRFTRSGQPRAVAPGKIVLLGVLRGMPVFANPGDAAPMRAEIEALAATGLDLEQALQKRLALRRQMSRIRTLYVPTSLVNCTFQTLTRPAPRRR